MHPIGLWSLVLLSFISMYFYFLLLVSVVITWLFSSALFSLHVFVLFIVLFLRLISNLIVLWSEKMLETVLVLLNLLRLDL